MVRPVRCLLGGWLEIIRSDVDKERVKRMMDDVSPRLFLTEVRSLQSDAIRGQPGT